MHTLNLGFYDVINAEGLIMLAEHRAQQWHCTFTESFWPNYNISPT